MPVLYYFKVNQMRFNFLKVNQMSFGHFFLFNGEPDDAYVDNCSIFNFKSIATFPGQSL